VAGAEVSQTVTEITETLEAWVQVTEIKTVADLVAEADLTTDRYSVVAVAEAEQQLEA
jgi:hypothetical protein